MLSFKVSLFIKFVQGLKKKKKTQVKADRSLLTKKSSQKLRKKNTKQKTNNILSEFEINEVLHKPIF